MYENITLQAKEALAFRAHTDLFQLLWLLPASLFGVSQDLTGRLRDVLLIKVELYHGVQILLFLKSKHPIAGKFLVAAVAFELEILEVFLVLIIIASIQIYQVHCPLDGRRGVIYQLV